MRELFISVFLLYALVITTQSQYVVNAILLCLKQNMKWRHKAKFGVLIHIGLYSNLGKVSGL
jgi:hypothetical protein